MSVTRAIILAAGASARLGRPKALVDFDGVTALALVLGALRAAGVAAGAVVVGRDAALIERAVDARPFEIALNPDPSAGRTGSVQVGLNALAAEGGAKDDVLLWPVDRPLGSTSTVCALVEAAAGAPDGVGWVVPTCGGRRGHPILLRSAALAFVRLAGPGESLREVLRATGLEPLEVPVVDAGIHVDIDTEEDRGRALAWWRGRTAR